MIIIIIIIMKVEQPVLVILKQMLPVYQQLCAQYNNDPDITEDQDRFCCDDCLLGFHPGCEEDCEACRSIASISINKNIAQITRSVHAVSEENTSMRMLPTLSQLQFQLVRIHLFSRYTKK